MEIKTPRQLLVQIKSLETNQPLAAQYAGKLRAAGIWSDEGVWYSSQKEHWEGWLTEYSGPGAYGRQVAARFRSAEFAYNHIVCAPMLLWLAEASGVPRAKVALAEKVALQSGRRLQSHCAAIRRVVPWKAVEEALVDGSRGMTSSATR